MEPESLDHRDRRDPRGKSSTRQQTTRTASVAELVLRAEPGYLVKLDSLVPSGPKVTEESRVLRATV